MAYVSYDHARSVGVAPRINTPRLAWSRLAMVGTCIGFWFAVGFVIRLIF